MRNLLSKLLSPAALLYIYLILMRVAYGVYLAADFEPPPAFALAYFAGFLWIIGWWLLSDSQKRGISWVYDLGLFLAIAWPFIMPYYLIKTRGAKGLLVILAFVGTYIIASAVGAIAYLLLLST